MGRRAIADSDEDEDTRSDDGADTGVLRAGGRTNTHTPLIACDGTNEKSTGSTEHLRRQLQSAERGLFRHSATEETHETMTRSSASTSGHAGVKRSHTAAVGLEAHSSPSMNAKRSKSLKTYDAKGRSHMADEHGCGDDVAAPNTSQSATFTEHSGTTSSAVLPPGSIGHDFLDHEPNVLFHDSGSTVADNSSTQQRLLEVAMTNDRQPTNTLNAVYLMATQLQPSSLSWPASGSHGNLESDGQQHQSQNEDVGALLPEPHATDADHTADEPVTEGRTSDTSYVTANAELQKPSNSPIVEIQQRARRASTSSRRSSVGSQTTANGRKRKAATKDDDTDPLNSDDRAIGLPKECYQPRPSRRRATQVLEQPVDLSVRPERAAKIKRTKTADSVVGATARRSSVSISKPNDNATASEVTASHTAGDVSADLVESPLASKCAFADNASQTEGRDDSHADGQAALPSTQQSEISGSQGDNDTGLFVKPAKPTSKRKPGPKSKRSHTTIFEDHVEFVGSQRTPNLSQLQAKRKAALKTASNESSAAQRKRKVVVSDDENDDDAEEAMEDANEAGEEDEAPPPKKRGRGRPPKSTATQPKPKSSEKILNDSEDDGENDIEADLAPKKARGRPSKASLREQSNNTAEPEVDEPSMPNASTNLLGKTAGESVEEERATEINATPTSSRPAAKIPTPSPEKENAAPAKNPKQSPASHSPIKSSSRVPLRVGLSRRQRIPSLLRVMKPPPAR